VPAIILYFSTWFKRNELQLRIGYFWGAASLSGAIGGLLAAAIANLSGKGGLEGWSWVFIIDGMRVSLMSWLPFRSLLLPSPRAIPVSSLKRRENTQWPVLSTTQYMRMKLRLAIRPTPLKLTTHFLGRKYSQYMLILRHISWQLLLLSPEQMCIPWLIFYQPSSLVSLPLPQQQR
jgi:MFS family permease